MQKKPRIGLIIFLVVLAVLIMIPVGLYCYLSISSARIDEQRAAYVFDDPYRGAPMLHSDGRVDIPLTEPDIYWLIDQYRLLDDLQKNAYGSSIRSYAIKFQQDGLFIYVNAELFGFLPVPLKFTVDASCNGGIVYAAISELHVGESLNVPLEKLSTFHLPETFRFDLNGADLLSDVTGVSFLSDGVTLHGQFLDNFLSDALHAAQRSGVALAIYAYEGVAAFDELPVLSPVLGRDPLQNGLDADSATLVSYLAGSKKPGAAIAELLALCSETRASALLSTSDPFTLHFLLEQAAADATPLRAERLQRVAQGQSVYEGLLNALREKYRCLGLSLDINGFLDIETGKPLSLAALYPAANVTDAESRAVLLYSNDALNAVMTSDMPLLSNVPRVSGKAVSGLYASMPYDIGILLPMPCGSYAFLYRQADGQFVINFVAQATVDETRLSTRLSAILSDSIPRPPTRMLYDAPTEGLSKYAILVPLPDDVSQPQE